MKHKGIHLITLLQKLELNQEVTRIENHYATLYNNQKHLKKHLDYSFCYRGHADDRINDCLHLFVNQLDTVFVSYKLRLKQIFDNPTNLINTANLTIPAEELKVLIAFAKGCITDASQIAQMANSVGMLPDELDRCLKTLVYAVSGLKIYSTIIQNPKFNISSFLTSNGPITLDDAIHDFEQLKQLEANENTNSTIGKNTCNYFNFQLRAKTSTAFQKSLDSLVKNLQFVGKMISYVSRHQRLQHHFKTQLIGDFTPNEFRPVAVKQVVNVLQQFNKKTDSMLCPTGGWGGRLIGVLATPAIQRYVETDPNLSLQDVKAQMLDNLLEYSHFKDKRSHIFLHDRPIEEIPQELLCPNQIKNDFSLFSPPYFDVEKYPDNDNYSQSYVKYRTLESWIRLFFIPLLLKNYHALNVGGVMAINIASFIISPSLLGHQPAFFQQNYDLNIIKENNSMTVQIDLFHLLNKVLCKDKGLGMSWRFMKKIHYHLHGRKENAIYLFESLETSEVPRSLTEPTLNAMDLNPNPATPYSNTGSVSDLNNMDIDKSADNDEILSSELKENTTQSKKRMISAISSLPPSFFQNKKQKSPFAQVQQRGAHMSI